MGISSFVLFLLFQNMRTLHGLPMHIYDGYGPCEEPHHGSETLRRSEILCVTLKFRLFGFHSLSTANWGCFGEKFWLIEDCEVIIMRQSA